MAVTDIEQRFAGDRRMLWIASEWQDYADRLAEWAMERLANRRDVWSQYTLRDGEVRVHLCRRDESDTRSMTDSQYTDLYLMNGGDGLRPTDESLAVAVETLALILRRNEEQGVELPDALMTHAARLNFFATDRKLL